MKLSVGADMDAPLVHETLKQLKKHGHEVIYYGPKSKSSVPWPEVARQVAEDVASGRCKEGILFGWTGTGVSIVANKINGIRAALCGDAETAKSARVTNNANVLCLSIRATSEALAGEILTAWFSNHYQSTPNNDACQAEIRELEQSNNLKK
ncbi:MAG TPA: RpiB/LacA/LacB family sugar-phosphate isomerase [Anaerolineaceae bacterium]|nr:RpiB/LacA/LacB family sugar-phosphate isomerase [Anaerolineaceae bacterium]HPN52418.1 RpiB/LacA/LacB family sugar-phosphate isomerase [Anaerolineaceae bacterium]